MSAVASVFITKTIEPVTCGSCQILFGLEVSHHAKLRRTGAWFHCPNGHQIHYYESDEQKLRDELVRQKARTDQAEEDARCQRRRVALKDRQISARKAVATRLRNKIARGRCPCCSHQFKDLERHMKTEHPKWSPEKAADALVAKAGA